eukprot:4012642-Pleurochrysis_carterae.AAC.1
MICHTVAACPLPPSHKPHSGRHRQAASQDGDPPERGGVRAEGRHGNRRLGHHPPRPSRQHPCRLSKGLQLPGHHQARQRWPRGCQVGRSHPCARHARRRCAQHDSGMHRLVERDEGRLALGRGEVPVGDVQGHREGFRGRRGDAQGVTPPPAPKPTTILLIIAYCMAMTAA